MKEIFRDIKGYEDCYEVSNKGRIKSLKRFTKHFNGGNRIVKERILKPCVSSKGYLMVCFRKNGKQTTKQVHQLVAIAFLNPCFNKFNTSARPSTISISSLSSMFGPAGNLSFPYSRTSMTRTE